MTPQDKCVSLETAKKLKEAGFPQETVRVWIELDHGPGGDWRNVDVEHELSEHGGFASPDAQEISKELPFRNKRMGTVNDARLTTLKLPYDKWLVWYEDEDTKEDKTPRFQGSMCEAFSACWLYLVEQKLIYI